MMNPKRALPPLLPRTAPGQSGPPRPPRSVDSVKKRKGIACEACRLRKTRCDGNTPKCHECNLRKSTCNYPEAKMRIGKRKYEELAQQTSAHEKLFTLLRTMTQQESNAVFQQIRAGHDVESILNRVEEGDLLLNLAVIPERRFRYEFPYMRQIPARLLQGENEYLEIVGFNRPNVGGKKGQTIATQTSHSDGAHRSVYKKPYYAAEFVDAKLGSIRPSEWTSVISDDRWMRKILGRFFLTEYHLGFFFHKDYFLEDMMAQGDEFCSSLLVNAVLALACFCDLDNVSRAQFWNPDNLGYRFLSEARRLWELESSEPKLTTIQAAVVFNTVYNMNGLDKIGYEYNVRAVAMAKELGLFRPLPDASAKMQAARDFTAWNLYAVQGPNSYMMRRRPLLDYAPVAPLPDPSENPGWYGELLFKFPSAATVFSSCYCDYLWARIKLWSIAILIASKEFVDDIESNLPISRVLSYYTRFKQWYDTLPESLRPKRIVTPHQLQLHMQYHNFIINLLEEPMTTTLNLPENRAQTLSAIQSEPREVLQESKHSMEILVRLYFVRHGFEASGVFTVQFLSLLAFNTYAAICADKQMLPDTLQALQSTIILVATALRDQSHSYYLGQLVFNAVRNGMGDSERNLIDRFVGEGRGTGKHPPAGWQAQSIWVMDFGSITGKVEERRLANLIKSAGDISGK